MTKSEIDKRLGQITFNAPLQKELEAIGMMKKLVRKEGEPISRLGRKIESLQLHHLSAEDYVDGLSQSQRAEHQVGLPEPPAGSGACSG